MCIIVIKNEYWIIQNSTILLTFITTIKKLIGIGRLCSVPIIYFAYRFSFSNQYIRSKFCSNAKIKLTYFVISVHRNTYGLTNNFELLMSSLGEKPYWKFTPQLGERNAPTCTIANFHNSNNHTAQSIELPNNFLKLMRIMYIYKKCFAYIVIKKFFKSNFDVF